MRALGSGQKEVTLLDYGAGNVRSVRNAILKLGYTLKEVGSSGGSRIKKCEASPAFYMLRLHDIYLRCR